MLNWTYTKLLKKVSLAIYHQAFEYFQPDSRILEIGIGNGLMLATYHQHIKDKNLHILGVDRSSIYLKNCQKLVDHHDLKQNIQLVASPIEDFLKYFPAYYLQNQDHLWNGAGICALPNIFKAAQDVPENLQFDYIFFSQSFPLLDNGEEVLKKLHTWLKPKGELLFIQTFFHKSSRMMEVLKPNIKYFTTVDFGKMTYEESFLEQLAGSRWDLHQNKKIHRFAFGGELKMILAGRSSSDIYL